MVMDKKTNELTAIGASVAGGCVPCLRYHLSAAREAGATEMEIREAVSIGEMIEGKVKEHLDAVIKGITKDNNKDDKSDSGCNSCCDSC